MTMRLPIERRTACERRSATGGIWQVLTAKSRLQAGAPAEGL